MEQGPPDFEEQPTDIEALDLFMQDIKKLDDASRKLILDVIRENKIGVLTIKIDDLSAKRINTSLGKTEVDKIDEIMDALTELEPLVKPDLLAQAVGEDPETISASFEAYH